MFSRTRGVVHHSSDISVHQKNSSSFTTLLLAAATATATTTTTTTTTTTMSRELQMTFLHRKSCFQVSSSYTIAGSGSWLARANGAEVQCCSYNTPPLQSTTPGLHPISIHQMAPPVRGSKHLTTAYYTVYQPQKDERMRWPSWLTCSRRFTYISGHPPAAARAQDRESSPAKDRRSTARPRHQQSR